MPGNQTQRYDAVLEFSETSVQGILSTFFDSGGLLSTFLNGVGLGSADGAFALDVLFDRPSDIPIPAGSTDVLDLRFDIGPNGSLGQLRAVAGLSMNRGSGDFDIAEIDFKNQLLFTSFTAGGIQVPLMPQLFADFLRNTVSAAPVIPVPVKRGATNPADLPVRGDIHLIDDPTPNNRDALAIMLTFAGGLPGNAAGLQDFVNPGDSGAMAVFFRWLARILRPKVAKALSTDEANFDIGDDFLRLNNSIPVSGGGNDAELRQLEMRLENGFIELSGTIGKSGFCYDASGKISGRIKIGIVNGQLTFESDIDDPKVNVDIPWYCWLGAAVVGAIAGGLVGILIGAVVGAVGGSVVGGVVVGGIVGAIMLGILVPVLLAIAQNVLEATVEGVGGSLADKLKQNLQVPAVGLNLIFQQVFIDDIAIHFRANPIETVPIRASGLLEVHDGQLIDLDNGQVGSEELGSGDLEWKGRGLARVLHTRCGATLARTGLTDFAGMLRWKLYPLAFADASVPLGEFAIPFPLGGLGGLFGLGSSPNQYIELGLVYAVRTAEGRFSVIQVAEVLQDRIRLRYRTYEKRLPSVQLLGEFSCERWRVPDLADKLSNIRFVADPAFSQGCDPAPQTQPAPQGNRLGQWKGDLVITAGGTGNFRAVVENIGGELSYHWHVAGTDLVKKQGSLEIAGHKASYRVNQDRLSLTLKSARAMEFLVKVTVIDTAGNSVSASKCVRYNPVCKREVVAVPSLEAQLETYHQLFGVVRVPVASKAPASPAPSTPNPTGVARTKLARARTGSSRR
jgi:hypothetical protein